MDWIGESDETRLTLNEPKNLFELTNVYIYIYIIKMIDGNEPW